MEKIIIFIMVDFFKYLKIIYYNFGVYYSNNNILKHFQLLYVYYCYYSFSPHLVLNYTF